jgi:transcriptional regulator of acetoin/glycerol metabolism
VDATITSVSLGRGREAVTPGARPLLVMLTISDEPTVASSRHVLDGVDEVQFGRGPRESKRTVIDGKRVLVLKIPDRRMSSDHGRLYRGASGWVLDDPGSKNGTVVDGVLTRRALIETGCLFELGHTFFLHTTGELEESAPMDVLADELAAPAPTLTTFLGSLAKRFDSLAKIARTGVSVVLLGETGTGKEVVARALHELSARPGPFVAVNCGALPETLLEAELFGHRRGAFSGAVVDRPGLVRSADRGTLFLDEIGELPAPSQTAFLRVLQEQEVVPVGDDRPVKVDVRLCAATLRDLDALVEAGTFRRDLYARLFGVSIELPPLRDRRQDLGILLRALIKRVPGGDRMKFAPAALRALVRHDWPLNVRELEKTLVSAAALSNDGMVEIEHLPAPVRNPTPRAQTPAPAAAQPPPQLDEEERALRDQLMELLGRHKGNVLAVAQEMGKRRMQIYRWAKRFAIDLDAFRK